MNRRIRRKLEKRADGRGYLSRNEAKRRPVLTDSPYRRRLNRVQSAGVYGARRRLGRPAKVLGAAIGQNFEIHGATACSRRYLSFGKVRVRIV